MNIKLHILEFMVTPAILLTVSSAWAAESVVTAAMAGHWEGNARIVVSWCHQTNLPVKIDIHADGNVTGTVGDAQLKKGHFQQNRGWLGRQLNLATDFIVQGNLEGALVAAEGITRERVMMPLNFDEGAFKGGVNTSGKMLVTKDQMKEQMPLSAASLRLTHSQ